MRNKVSFLLILTLSITGLLPLLASYFVMDDILSSQQRIYLNQNISQTLTSFENNLKKLSKLDPQSKDSYRLEFEKVQNLKLLYGDDTYFGETIHATAFKYFFIIFGLALVIALFSGVVLSFKVNQIYVASYRELAQEKEKSSYLSEMAKWQDVAKKLAHEIRRPLQPMRIWLSQLQKASVSDQKMIKEAAAAIDQEVLFLSEMVTGFSEFAQIPKPNLETVELDGFIRSFLSQYSNIWPQIKFSYENRVGNLSVMLDQKIFRTLFANIIENAAEANLNRAIDMQLAIRTENEMAIIDIFNSGKTLSESDREKIFDIYYSTKLDAKNMGLGLAIVKTIVLEHGGDIKCIPVRDGVKFEIQLPLEKG